MTEGLLLGSRNYWFVDSYLLLVLLAPILNLFCEKAARNEFKTFLITAFGVEAIAAWIFPTLSTEFRAGYSTFSFVLIYLLARYFRIYQPKLSQNKAIYDIGIYLTLSLALSIISYISHGGIVAIIGFYSYASPFVITSALFCMLAFIKFKIKSRFINFIASSCFAVYLLHEHVSISVPIFRQFVKILYISDTPFTTNTIDIIGFILIVYLLSIILDKVRIRLAKLIIQ